MEHRYRAESDHIIIRPLYEADIEKLRVWRNNPQLSMYLRTIPYITLEKQLSWYRSYLNDPDSIFFVVIDRDTNYVVGTVALYHFNGDSCEVGRIVIGDSSAHGKGIGYGALLLAMVVAFKKMNIASIRLNVHEDNIAARKIYDRAGFHEVGLHEFSNGGLELELQISSEEFFNLNIMTNEIRITEDKDMNAVLENGGGVLQSK